MLPAYAAVAAFCAVAGPMQDIPVAVLQQTELPQRDIQAAARALLGANQLGNLLGLVITPALLGLLLLAGGLLVVVLPPPPFPPPPPELLLSLLLMKVSAACPYTEP